MKKKILASLLSTGMVFSVLGNTTYAAEDTMTIEKANKVLVEFGYDKEQVPYMDEDRKIEMANSIQEDPSSIKLNTSYIRTNNIEQVEYYVNSTDAELEENGVSKDEVKEIRKKLKDLRKMSKQDLGDGYGLTKGETKLIKKALKKNKNYKAPKKLGNDKVTTSGTISSSTLRFDMTVDDKSTSSRPEYDVDFNHNWYDPFFFDIVSDNVAAAWGGNLNTKDVGGLTYYTNGDWYDGEYGSAWGSLYTNGEVTPNTGVIYTFEQSVDNASAQAKNGHYWVTLYQTSKDNRDTTLVSQYAHKVLTVGNVTVTKVPSINLGIGKDASRQERETLTY